MIHFAFFATIWIEAERKGPQVLSMRSLSRRQEGPIPKASIHKAPFWKNQTWKFEKLHRKRPKQGKAMDFTPFRPFACLSDAARKGRLFFTIN